jgi:hypothetical protein
MKLLAIVFFILANLGLAAQQSDSVFIVKCMDGLDSGALPFTTITVLEDEKITKGYNADVNGIVVIDARKICANGFSVRAGYPGRYTVEVKTTSLKLNDTTVLVLEPTPVELGIFTILQYKVPLIEKEYRWWQRKPKPVVFIPDTVYSADTIAQVNLLREGNWVTADTLKSNSYLQDNEIGKYLSRTIRYPTCAIENNIEGRIYMTFQLDENGNITGLKLVHGKDAALALEVANALSRMPRLKMYPDRIPGFSCGNSVHSVEQKVEPKPVKPPVFSICVEFRLQ